MVSNNMETMQIFNATGIFGARPVAWLLTLSMLFDAAKCCGPQAGFMGPQGPGGQANPNGTFLVPGITTPKTQNSTGSAPPTPAGAQSTSPKAAGGITPVPALLLPGALPTTNGPLNPALQPVPLGLNVTSLPGPIATTKLPAGAVPITNTDLSGGSPNALNGTIPAASQTVPKIPAQGGPPFNQTEHDFVDSEAEQEPTNDAAVDQPNDDIGQPHGDLLNGLNNGTKASAIALGGNGSSQPTNESSPPMPPASDPGLVAIPVASTNVSTVSRNNSTGGAVGQTTTAGSTPGGVPGVVGIPMIPPTSNTINNTTNNSISDKPAGNSETGSSDSQSSGNQTASDDLIGGNAEPENSGSQSNGNETAIHDLIGGNSKLGSSASQSNGNETAIHDLIGGNSELGGSGSQSNGNQTASDDLIGGNSGPERSGSQSNGNATVSDDLIGGGPDNYNSYDGLMDDGSNAQNGTASPDFESPSYGNEPGVPGGAAIGGNGTVSVNSTQIGPQDFPLGHEDTF